MRGGTKREWELICSGCEQVIKRWVWNYDLDSQTCDNCQSQLFLYQEERGSAPGIIGDSIPGGLEIRHGLVDPVPLQPRKFYSKTEIKRAANEAGLSWSGDTPKPYPVQWSGVRKRRADEKYDISVKGIDS